MSGRDRATWRALAFATLLVGVCGVTAAEKKRSSVSGRVFRSDIDQGVTGAKVWLFRAKGSEVDDSSLSTTTDRSGRFWLASVQEGEYSVTVEARYERRADAPCKIQFGRNQDARGAVFTQESGGEFKVTLLLTRFKVRAGRAVSQDFDLVCGYWFVVGP